MVCSRTQTYPLNTIKFLTLEAALARRCGFDEQHIVAQYGPDLARMSGYVGELSLLELARRCVELEGRAIYGDATPEAYVNAAFSTVSLQGLLGNVARQQMLCAYREQPLVAPSLCAESDVSDFRINPRLRLSIGGDLDPVAPDGRLKHAGVTEESAAVQLETYGKALTLTRKMIINDDLGALRQAAKAMGARAKRKIDALFFECLLDNDGLFTKRRANYADGPDTALTAESLDHAIQMIQNQTDTDGTPLSLEPKYLLVPPSLKMAARELVKSTTLAVAGVGANGASVARMPTYNGLRDEDIEILVSPHLSNPRHPKASAKGWYVFADPALQAGFEITYLRGIREPQLSEGNFDGDQLGMHFAVLFDVNVTAIDHRGMVFFKGQ